MKLNKIYNQDFLTNSIPDKSIDLIIADPPYFEVKGGFDFIWNSFEEYLQDVEKWAKECKRVLKDSGSLFWWGHSKKVAYSQIILDKYFNLENNMTWRKIDSIQYQYYSVDLSRSFNTHNERILFYSNEIDKTGSEMIAHSINLWKPIIKKLQSKVKDKQEIYKCFEKDGRYTSKQSIKTHSHYKYGYGSRFDLMDKRLFNICNEYFKYDFTYEELRQEYEELRRPFNNFNKIEDCWSASQESYITRKYKHPTKKPEGIARYMIQCCSRKGPTVLVPFAGSGTECAMAVKEKRNFIGFEIDKKYHEIANKRVDEIMKQPEIF